MKNFVGALAFCFPKGNLGCGSGFGDGLLRIGVVGRGKGDEVAVGLEVFDELGVETVAGEGLSVADDDEFHAGAGDGDVHAAEVVEEADGTLVVVAYHADEDDIAFLPLEAVDSGCGD